jgi:hypothetical protein
LHVSVCLIFGWRDPTGPQGIENVANRSEFSTGIIFGLQGMPERIAIGIAIASSRRDRQL